MSLATVNLIKYNNEEEPEGVQLSAMGDRKFDTNKRDDVDVKFGAMRRCAKHIFPMLFAILVISTLSTTRIYVSTYLRVCDASHRSLPMM